ncbi:histidine n-acetyltransferase-like [Plakobranchus ocellatus]|uniref:Histidine n-acetyltransferase-like n=1 Tax=Plakobranchus ocellatus TaxID=259542 RepID=A0AAV3XTY6_9GAST|nr:histidine n-acetyltransferase-like [Plakobranchus ocellatus]
MLKVQRMLLVRQPRAYLARLGNDGVTISAKRHDFSRQFTTTSLSGASCSNLVLHQAPTNCVSLSKAPSARFFHKESPVNFTGYFRTASHGFPPFRAFTDNPFSRTAPSACGLLAAQSDPSCQTFHPAVRKVSYVPNKEVHIRKALLSDRETVCGLGDIDGGQDYVYALYDEFVTHPDSYAIVATLNDVVIGFAMVTALDGGRTIMRRASRVNENYRKRGVFLAMKAELDRYISEDCPKIEQSAVCKCDKDDYMIGMYADQGYYETYRREGIQMIFKPATYQAINRWDEQPIEAREITADELSLLFRTADVKKKLFPSDRLLNFYLPYHLIEENVRHLICERGGVFVSFEDAYSSPESSLYLKSHKPHKEVLKKSDIPMPPSRDAQTNVGDCLDAVSVDNVTMASFYYCYPTLKRPCYFLDVYARPGTSRDHFRAHLHQNLSVLRHYFPDQEAILALTFESIPSDNVMLSLHEAGIVDVKPEPEKYQVLFEHDWK